MDRNGKPVTLPIWTLYLLTLTNLLLEGGVIGKVGNTGNAAGKPTHLHYAIQTLFPYLWLYDSQAVKGWKKMFYLNPVDQLNLSGYSTMLMKQ